MNPLLARKRGSILYSLTVLLAVFAMTLLPLWAQTDLGSVRGTVWDNTGAAIAGATATLSSVETGLTRTVKTDGSGNFSFEALPRGNYQVRTEITGFESQIQTVELKLSQVLTVNFNLKPGSVSTTVTVTDANQLVDTATSSTGAVIEGRQVTELPLNGRNFTQLALLTPGVTRGAYGSDAGGTKGNVEFFRYNESGSASLSANGLRQQANNFQLDGVDNNDSLVNAIVFFPPVEATQEFRVNTSVAPAEFGRAGGAIVQSSIKSGTNSIHGSAFEFYRDQTMDANNTASAYFATKPQTQVYRRHMFGFTAGGPIIKNRLFAFGDYQAQRIKEPGGGGIVTVPTAKMRTGDFSELLANATPSHPLTTAPDPTLTGCHVTYTPGAIYDPVTCQPFAGNIIGSRANSAGLKYLQAFPMPTPGLGTDGFTKNNYRSTETAVQNFNDFDVRLDYNLSQHDLLFARYSYGQENFPKDSQFDKLPSGYGTGTNVNHPRGMAAGYTHTFTPNLVNEFRYGYVRPYYAFLPPFFGTPVSANLGIQNANRNALLGGGALIGGNGGYNEQLEYTGDWGAYMVPQHTHQFFDAISWTFHQHTIKAGGTVIHREVDFFNPVDSKGYFILGGVNYPGTGRFTGYEVSELLAGFSDYRIGVASQYFKTINWESGIFVQDDWKVNHKLTLNLGLRYDLYTYPYEKNNNQSNFDLATQTLKLAGANGNSRSLIDTDTTNFAPRIGFAYDVFGNGKTALRGGYGMFYFLDRGGVGNQLSNNPDFNGYAEYQAANGYRITFTGQGALNDNDSRRATNPLPLPVFGQTVDRSDPRNVGLISVPKNSKTPRVQEWNLQIQQQLDAKTALNIAYVGTKSDHLSTWFNLNAPMIGVAPGTTLYPLRGTITEGANIGTSKYNGLQVYLERRMTNGLQFTAAYTFSHTLDNSNGAFSTGTNGAGGRLFIRPTGPDMKANYGNSDQDQRQSFVFSALTELPFGKGKYFGGNASPWLNQIIGGWQANTVVTLQGGTPFDVVTNQALTPSGTLIQGLSIQNRVDKIGPIHYKKSLHQWFDPSSFAPPPTISNTNLNYARPGTLGRNQLFGPSYRSMDLAVFKKFPIMSQYNLELRAQAYNLTNTPQFTNPNATIDAGNTGSFSGFAGINATRLHTERQMELAARFTF